MKSIDYEIIEFELINKLRFSSYIMFYVIFIIAIITIPLIISTFIFHKYYFYILNLIIIPIIFYPVRYQLNKYIHKKTTKYKPIGILSFKEDRIQIKFSEIKEYQYSELKRIYYNYDKPEFDNNNRFPPALSYKLTIRTNDDLAIEIRILRKYIINSLLQNEKNDLETILETLRRTNFKIYQTIRNGE
jgi:hypothetical protein